MACPEMAATDPETAESHKMAATDPETAESHKIDVALCVYKRQAQEENKVKFLLAEFQ